ncbi:hypothetical protein HYPDE_30348 [Hyphomicrobium denitrificans 1NES1]|uniref:Uncharacterized protein n=1 Tax=Hyphomicrobium denitrificans 1NES1 TaxID=670307 RepID=N0B2J7_9HYPH|nr:hypothetical protein HYPDE_30348 [Hyphomicrobium denitrificans 1NES1]
MSREGVMASVMSILMITRRRLEDGSPAGEGRRCGYRDISSVITRGFTNTNASGAIQPIQADAA